MKNAILEVLIFIGVVGFFGGLASTARYINDLGRSNRSFRFGAWLSTVFVGVIVSIFAGFACRHIGLSEELSYVVIGISAISARELIFILPGFVVKLTSHWIDKK